MLRSIWIRGLKLGGSSRTGSDVTRFSDFQSPSAYCYRDMDSTASYRGVFQGTVTRDGLWNGGQARG